MIKQEPHVFNATLDHIKKHTLYENSMMPPGDKNIIDQAIARRDKLQKEMF